MDNFQSSMAGLLAHISFEAEKNAQAEDDDPSPSAPVPSERKRKRMADQHQSQSQRHPVEKRKKMGDQHQSQPQQPSREQPQQQSPYTLNIPFQTQTLDTFPEDAATLFNQVMVLPIEFALHRENYDLIYASILYNMGLVLHNYGLQYSCGKSLRKALETYEVAHGVLVHELQRRDGMPGNDIHHWLLYALFNNMANIYNFARSPVMTQYCLERLRLVLSYSDSKFLETDDLLFYVVNLDVLGGPGVISAAAA